MKKKIQKKISKGSTRRGKGSGNMKSSLARHLTVEQGQLVFMPPNHQSNDSRFQNHLDSEVKMEVESSRILSTSAFEGEGADVDLNERDFILSQDFFCTPDYITPEAPANANSFDLSKDGIACPKSPDKFKSTVSKRRRFDGIPAATIASNESSQQEMTELEEEGFAFSTEEVKLEDKFESSKSHGYVSQSAVALRCRVMPPPCIRNPYLKDDSEVEVDPYGNQRSKYAGLYPAIIGGDGLSRYRTDFHEIEQIGNGNFSHVFKVLKRIDGCMYAVKHGTKKLYQDTERRKALMEVQALAAVGAHENIVTYYSSWFENEQLYIQMELCDYSLASKKPSKLMTEGEALEAMYQIAMALQFIHEKGIAHLDVKPDNIYVKNGVYKLGDFGCATRVDQSLPIEEGDARYMPQEILNEKYDHLDKVDIFSLGAAIYELARGFTLPESGAYFLHIREGKLPLLPGHSLQFQNLLKTLMDPDPVRRPSAKELLGYPIFDRIFKCGKSR